MNLPTFPQISEMNCWLLTALLICLTIWAFCKFMAAESKHWQRLKKEAESKRYLRTLP